MESNYFNISPDELCKKLNRFSIESLYEAMFYFGAQTIDISTNEERTKKWAKNPNTHPWNINYLFNLSLLKNFKQPEKQIDLKHTSYLLNACWENFNRIKDNILKLINSLFYNELIFQEFYKIYSLRNLFFLMQNKLNHGIQILENKSFCNIIDSLICTPQYIDFSNQIIDKLNVRNKDISVRKKLYLAVLNKLNVLDELKTDYFSIQKHVAKETDKLKAMLTISPLFNWPLVEYKGMTFIPCPQMLIMSTGYSLINRVSFGVQNKDKILSSTMEQYVFNIINGSLKVKKIWKEFEYGKKGKKKLTSDVIFCAQNKLIFCECKLKRVSTEFRQFTEEKINEMIDELANDFMQLYKCISDYKAGALIVDEGIDDYIEVQGKLVVLESIPQLLVNLAYRQFIEKCSNDKIAIYKDVIDTLEVVVLYELEKTAFNEEEILNLFGFNFSETTKIKNSFFEELEKELNNLYEETLSGEDFAQLAFRVFNP